MRASLLDQDSATGDDILLDDMAKGPLKPYFHPEIAEMLPAEETIGDKTMSTHKSQSFQT